MGGNTDDAIELLLFKVYLNITIDWETVRKKGQEEDKEGGQEIKRQDSGRETQETLTGQLLIMNLVQLDIVSVRAVGQLRHLEEEEEPDSVKV